MSASSSGPGRVKVGIALRNKAAWVHDRLTKASEMNAPLGEETITETLLLDLALELGPHLTVEPFTKYIESHKTGADWEWWFCDGRGQPVFGMRVQSKKLKKTKGGVLYYDLNYASKNGKRQVDRLCESAEANRLPAVYALYNGPELDLSQFSWPCCNEPASPAVFGVSMLSGNGARFLADNGNMTLGDVGQLSLPWSCCALCPRYLGLNYIQWPPDDPIPAELGELALWVGDMVTGLLIRSAQLDRDRSQNGAAAGRQGFRAWDEAPGYVRQIVDAVVGSRGNQRPDLDGMELELPRDLAGVSVWMALPVDQSVAETPPPDQ